MSIRVRLRVLLKLFESGYCVASGGSPNATAAAAVAGAIAAASSNVGNSSSSSLEAYMRDTCAACVVYLRMRVSKCVYVYFLYTHSLRSNE